MELEEILYEELIAFLPAYLTLKGNCTILYTNSGGIYEFEKTTKTVLCQLSKYYLMDLQATKKYYGDILGLKNLVPIPFNKEYVFIPVKIRKPICKNDGSMGYVSIGHIKKITESNGKTLIHLTNHEKIESLSSIETVNRHIKNGCIVKKLYEERHNANLVNEYDFYEEYDKPATKGDIAILINEILRIKSAIR